MSILTRLTREFAERALPESQYVVKINSDLNSSKLPVYLTFDDGPHPEFTPKILDSLNKLEAKATFFVLGQNVKHNKSLLRSIYEHGHSIGTHSWTHWSAREKKASLWINDIKTAQTEVEDILGCECNLFRPPYGEITPLALRYLIQSKFRIIQWSKDTKDFEAKQADTLVNWYKTVVPEPGEVILMHDNQKITAQHLLQACTSWKDKVQFCAIPMTGY